MNAVLCVETSAVVLGSWGILALMLFGMGWIDRPLLGSVENVLIPPGPGPVLEKFDYDVEETDLKNVIEMFSTVLGAPGDRKSIVRAKTIKNLKDYVALTYEGWGLQHMPVLYPSWLKRLETEPGSPGFEAPMDPRPVVVVLDKAHIFDNQERKLRMFRKISSAVFMLIWMLLSSKDTSEHNRSIRLRIANVWISNADFMDYSVVLVYDSEIIRELLPIDKNDQPVYTQQFESTLMPRNGEKPCTETRKLVYEHSFGRSVPQRIDRLDVHDIVCTYRDGDVIVETSTWDMSKKESLFKPVLWTFGNQGFPN